MEEDQVTLKKAWKMAKKNQTKLRLETKWNLDVS